MNNFDCLLEKELIKQKNNLNKYEDARVKFLNHFLLYLPEENLESIVKRNPINGNTTFEISFKKFNYSGVFYIYKYFDRDGTLVNPDKNFLKYIDNMGNKEFLYCVDDLSSFIKTKVIVPLAKSVVFKDLLENNQ